MMRSSLACLFVLFSVTTLCDGEWTHVEYGAGNYGDSRVFGNRKGRTDYTILLQTIDLLVREKGPSGIFYVNDLEEDWAQMAADTLAEYVKRRGWPVGVRVLAGDVTQIELPATDTAHLKHPSLAFLGLNRRTLFLRRLAEHSKRGLEVTTYFGTTFDRVIKQAKISAESFGRGLPYHFPSGEVCNKPSYVYRIWPIIGVSHAAPLRLLGRPYDEVDRSKLKPPWCARFLRTFTTRLLVFGK